MMNGGEHYALLRNLAMKVLAQCAANSSSERNWSMYKYIHSTIRNRLLADRAEKLVYMFCNENKFSHIEINGYEESMPPWVYDSVKPMMIVTSTLEVRDAQLLTLKKILQ